jgi:citrate synthase
MEMVSHFEQDLTDITDPDQVADYLEKILDKQAGDGSGLIYGMGHAVYTISDPRAELLKEAARKAVAGTELEPTFRLLELIQQLTPEIYARKKNNSKPMCANVDLYSGLVYRSLKIPTDLFTPLFAVARMTGWTAHRIEEMMTGSRIIRPAYKAIAKPRIYIPLENR